MAAPLNRRILVGLVVLAAAWVLTLGLFHERSIKTSLTVRGSDPWIAFENRELRLYPNAYLNSSERRRLGIPYLAHLLIDCPPYPLSFCFTAAANDAATALVIERLLIKYRDGSTQTIELPKGGQRSEFYTDERGKEFGKAVYRRVDFLFREAITKRQSFAVMVEGYLENESGREKYSEQIDVAVSSETYFYIGWIALAIRGT